MSVETRFLDQLVRAKKFGFLMTQLALSWEKDGVWKTMLLDKRRTRPPDK
jgi:heat shock protein HslJ